MSKLESNRANAQLSSGPRTEAGKSRSSRNAISHGLQSSDVVLAHEDSEEFLRILRHYQQQVDLTDPEQAFLAEQLAQAQWRLTRVQRLTRLYFDLEVAGFSDNPSPDEIIVRNMEQRGNDVPATLHRHETHFLRLWWRIKRKIEKLGESEAVPKPIEQRMRQPRMTQPRMRQYDEPSTEPTLAEFQLTIEDVEKLENRQTNPWARIHTQVGRYLVSLDRTSDHTTVQTKPTALAA
jgi:hypothetical protein